MISSKDVLKATQGVCVSGKISARLNGVSIDTRTLKKGDLFIAIKGSHFDGHTFIDQAIRKKASAVLVSQKKIKKRKNVPIIYVKDTTRALGQIARVHRRQFSIPIVAITGSNGKTTAKEMVAAVLSRRYRVLKSPATENNFYGVPLTLLRLKKSHQVAVLELGSSHPGEILYLTKIVEPNVVILTNIGDSHLAFLCSRRGVFKEKISIIQGMPRRGHIIFNEDDIFLRKIRSKRMKHKKIGYSIDQSSCYQATSVMCKINQYVHFTLNNRISFSLKTTATHNIYNALAAISCARLLKVGYKDIKEALARFPFLKGRLSIKKIAGLQIVDDTYNANPTSLKSALETVCRLKNDKRAIVVIGDMLELGKHAEKLHHQAGELIAAIHPNLVIAVGRYARFVTRGLKKENAAIKVFHFSRLEKANEKLKENVRKGDLIFIKGSRGLKMERVEAFLRKNFRG